MWRWSGLEQYPPTPQGLLPWSSFSDNQNQCRGDSPATWWLPSTTSRPAVSPVGEFSSQYTFRVWCIFKLIQFHHLCNLNYSWECKIPRGRMDVIFIFLIWDCITLLDTFLSSGGLAVAGGVARGFPDPNPGQGRLRDRCVRRRFTARLRPWSTPLLHPWVQERHNGIPLFLFSCFFVKVRWGNQPAVFFQPPYFYGRRRLESPPLCCWERLGSPSQIPRTGDLYIKTWVGFNYYCPAPLLEVLYDNAGVISV